MARTAANAAMICAAAITIGAISIGTITIGAPLQASAQEPEFSVDTFNVMTAEAEVAFEDMVILGTQHDGYEAAATVALDARQEAARYYSRWERSGDMPSELAADAPRMVLDLFADVIDLQVALLRCDDAQQMQLLYAERAVEEGLSDEAGERIAATQVAVSECGGGVNLATTEQVDEPPIVPELPLAVVIDPTTDVAAVRSPSGASGRDAVPWICMGTGAALTIAGTAIALGPLQAANSDIRDWNASTESSGDAAELARLSDEAHRHNVRASVLVVSGASLIATGVVIRLLSGNEGSTRDVAATLIPTRGGAHAVVGWSWK